MEASKSKMLIGRRPNNQKKPNNRRSLRRNKKKQFVKKLSFVGVNSAGLSSKLSSFESMLSALKPTVYFIEETKLKTSGKIKTESCNGYQIFELNRVGKSGGGLAIGALAETDPVWISEGDTEVEILVVEISVSELQIRCIAAYGPQEGATSEKKENFWLRLSAEIEDAIENEKGIIFQMDGNLWGGSELIKNDPKNQNNNGLRFKQFLEKFPFLTVVNNLDLCQGSITRKRITINGVEMSILDFFIVCDKLKPFIEKMIVDEDKLYGLSNYRKVKGKSVKKDSDHNTLILYLNLEYFLKKPDRVEYFNFRNTECQKIFFDKTNETKKLTACFQKAGNLESQAKNWLKELNGLCHQSFRKIRHKPKNKETETTVLLEKRRNILLKLKKAGELDQEDLVNELNKIEDQVSDSVAEKNRNKIVENFKALSQEDGRMNTNNMWSLKRKVFPPNRESLPFAKKNCDGKLISSHKQLKDLYLDTFVHRLRHRPMNKEYSNLKKLKEELCSKRLDYARMNKTKDWTIYDLEKVLSSLKINKSRDPHGFLNEIFKPGIIGLDLKNSLLMLLNKSKKELCIPSLMQLADIVAIYKGKGDKLSLENDRGIFILNIVRSIMMKLIYADKYDTIDEKMSDSNVGARKRKNIRNHLFILNGIINDAINSKEKCLDILIVDYKQCFDSMWLDECVNDLFKAGVQDDHLAVLYEANSKNQVAVKTPFGKTERRMVEKIVLQGEVFGPLECSVSVDSFGKECLNNEKLLYQYRGEVGVPPLAMIDDLVCPSVCGVDSVLMNSYINAKTRTKKLQFGVSKCHQLHVGKKSNVCPTLMIDNWELKKVDDSETGLGNLEDVLVGNHNLEKVDNDKYLGDIISVDGRNTKNIIARKGKAIGITNKIISILQEMCFGPYYFEVALILRNSLFLSSLLVNSEAWYGVTEDEKRDLEKQDEYLLRKIMDCPSNSPKCMLYLETGCKPIRFLIMMRQMMFLHYILKEETDSLIRRFLDTQARNPGRNDWVTTIKDNLAYLEIWLDFEQIEMCSEYQFRNLVQKSIEEKCFEYLVNEKNKKNKVKHIQYQRLEIQKYLSPGRISNHQAKKIFLLRNRMLETKDNFPNKFEDKLCPICTNGEFDSQAHLMKCPPVPNLMMVSEAPMYENLFVNDVQKQVETMEIITKNFKRRKIIIKNGEPSEP